MDLVKNQIVTAKIEDFSETGDGIARVGGMVVFVKGGVPGDECEIRILKVQTSLAFARVERLTVPSEGRVAPDCQAFPVCGGCVFRHVSYETELKYKVKRVTDAFSRIGGVQLAPEEVIGAKSVIAYRNKVQYPVYFNGKKTGFGFYRGGSHEVVGLTRCLNQTPATDALAATVCGFINRFGLTVYDEATGKGLFRHICIRESRDGKQLLCIVLSSEQLPHSRELVRTVCENHPQVSGIVLNVNPRNTNVIFGKNTIRLWGDDTLSDEVGGVLTDLSAVSFFQINREQTNRLYARAAEYAGRGVALLDLYCGAGVIGLSMAGRFNRILGIEILPEAVENARANALRNGAGNAEFICGDASAELDKLGFADSRPDVVVVDPPRKGLERAIIPKIAALTPDRVVYISCNPATCARDLWLFADEGYIAKRLTIVDMFPRTSHVETVVLMSRVEKQV